MESQSKDGRSGPKVALGNSGADLSTYFAKQH
jgi:hypothetical protein